MDVICGRGKQALNHPGNKRFRKLIDQHLDDYANAKTKLEKGMVVSKVIDQVEDEGGNFIKRGKSGVEWIIVDATFAREKTAHTIRDAIRSRQAPPSLRAANAAGSTSPLKKSSLADKATAATNTALLDLQRSIFMTMQQEIEESVLAL